MLAGSLDSSLAPTFSLFPLFSLSVGKKTTKEDKMNETLLKELAQELASKVNNLVDVPLVNEEDEQAFFELIILLLLELIFNRLGFKNVIEISPRA